MTTTQSRSMHIIGSAVALTIGWGVLLGAGLGGLYMAALSVGHGGTIRDVLTSLLVGGVVGAAAGSVLGLVDGLAIGLVTRVSFNPLTNPVVYRQALMWGNAALVFAGLGGGLTLLMARGNSLSVEQAILLIHIPVVIASAAAGFAARKYATRHIRRAMVGAYNKKKKRGE